MGHKKSVDSVRVAGNVPAGLSCSSSYRDREISNCVGAFLEAERYTENKMVMPNTFLGAVGSASTRSQSRSSGF